MSAQTLPLRPASLPADRPGHAAPDDLAMRRAGLAAAIAAGMWQAQTPPAEVIVGGVRCLRFAPQGPVRGTVLHFHGGAFRIGCPEQLGNYAATLAARCGVAVICPAYRLAPENPFPAGVADGWSVLAALVAVNDGPLFISGDSAGGGLAAGIAALAGQHGLKLAGLVLLSPWLDLSVTNPSYAENAASDPLFSADAAMQAAALYLQGHPLPDPVASPFDGPVGHYPPTLINVGSGEVLLDDARKMYDRLQAAGIPCRLHCVDDMLHVAVTRELNATGATETLDAMTDFILAALAEKLR